MPKLYVIAGHGAGDPGAGGGGKNEADLVRQLAAKMKALGGSDVEVLDTSRNWYKDGGVNASLKKRVGSAPVIELHLDSASASAKGGHVIIKSGLSADKYDNALAAFLKKEFPGRAEVIVKRGNLANINRAANHGINYRLVEVCFITNVEDRNRLIGDMGGIAKGILAAFGISSPDSGNPVSGETKPSAPSQSAQKPQAASLSVDGWWGPSTTRALQKALGTVQDGTVSGQDSSSMARVNRGGLQSSSWKIGRGGSQMVRALQKKLGTTADGYFGPNTCRALQKKLGTTADGIVSGPSQMVRALQKALNDGTF